MPKSTTALPIAPKPDHEPPHIFGRGMRDRLLMTLAVNRRPRYVAELCGLLGSDQRKVRKTLKALVGPFAATDFDLLFYSKVSSSPLLSIAAARQIAYLASRQRKPALTVLKEAWE